MRKAKVQKKSLYRGKVHRYWFTLHAANGEEIASTSRDDGRRTFTQKHECLETLKHNFPAYSIEDLTGE